MDAYVKTTRNRDNDHSGTSFENKNMSNPHYHHEKNKHAHYDDEQKQHTVIETSTTRNDASRSSRTGAASLLGVSGTGVPVAYADAAAVCWGGVSSSSTTTSASLPSDSYQERRRRRRRQWVEGGRRLEEEEDDDDGCETSSCYDADTSSCEDLRSLCSSPLSESSFCSSRSRSSICSEEESSSLQHHRRHNHHHYVTASSFSTADKYTHYHRQPNGLVFQLAANANANANANTVPSPLFLLDSDVVAMVMTFLEPSEILDVLTMPLSKEWQRSYGMEQDTWKTLCLLEPFKAKVGKEEEQQQQQQQANEDSSTCSGIVGSGSTDSFSSLPIGPSFRDLFGEYRLMFTSFVRCLRYLDMIQEDSQRAGGKAPYSSSDVDHHYGPSGGFPHFGMSRDLKRFLQQARGAFDHPHRHDITQLMEGASSASHRPPAATASAADVVLSTFPVGVTDDGYRKRRATRASSSKPKKEAKHANSMITSRILGPSSKGEPSHLQMPTSCAIFSIVNWMVAYPDVEGIQIRCVATLPVLLEDEAQRLTAQRVGLVDVVLQAMLRYPDCSKLHVAAFHAMVLLARPLGGQEGMLYDNSKAEAAASTIHNLGLIDHRLPSSSSSSSPSSTMHNNDETQQTTTTVTNSTRHPKKLNGINGVAVMLDSMRRFEGDADLQAMACWALVNLALVPSQKTMILSLGGIEVTANAMRRHPMHYDVQFRALFALINLVVASKNPMPPLSVINHEGGGRRPLGGVSPRPQHQHQQHHHTTEKDVLDATVQEVAGLVVEAMKNFCSSGTILNRACLVLHNLARSPEYLTTLLWTPQCYQMLEWCIANYPIDPVLRRSATSTLNRLQTLLSGNQSLRSRFLESIRAQEEENIALLQQQQQLQQENINRDAATSATPGPVVPNV